MICADREAPEPATELMLKGAELIIIPNACHWDDIRKIILKTRAFENQVGVAMATYPEPQNNGCSSAYDCVAWDEKGSRDITILEAGPNEGIYIAKFDINAIRSFRKMEKWRLDYRQKWHKKDL